MKSKKIQSFWLAVLAAIVMVALSMVLTPSVGAQQYHTVRSGEFLASIARRYSTTASELARLNNLSNPNLIYSGQRLIVPSTSTEKTYYVKNGDTLSNIANQLKTSISYLVARNNISDPNFLRIGQPIKYTGTSTASPSSFVYQVRSGDTLGKIAIKFETSVSAILALNNISNSNEVYVKDLIRVPSPYILSVMDYWAGVYGVPPDLLKALTWWESGWNNSLISSAGAIGIGQLIPSTVDFVSEALIGERLNPHNPEENVRMSARFLAYLIAETNGDTNYALAAYYQGLGAVRRYGVYNISWPYVNGIQALRPRFR